MAVNRRGIAALAAILTLQAAAQPATPGLAEAAAILAARCAAPLVVEDVKASSDGAASVQWTCGGAGQRDAFVRRYGIWWVAGGSPEPITVTSASPTTIAPDPKLTDEYLVSIALPSAQTGVQLRFSARMPTPGESWTSPGGDGEFFFTIENIGTRPVAVNEGTDVVVCYPFLMRSGYRRTISLAPAPSNVAPVPMRERGNCVAARLPAVSFAPGVEAHGEIDADRL